MKGDAYISHWLQGDAHTSITILRAQNHGRKKELSSWEEVTNQIWKEVDFINPQENISQKTLMHILEASAHGNKAYNTPTQILRWGQRTHEAESMDVLNQVLPTNPDTKGLSAHPYDRNGDLFSKVEGQPVSYPGDPDGQFNEIPSAPAKDGKFVSAFDFKDFVHLTSYENIFSGLNSKMNAAKREFEKKNLEQPTKKIIPTSLVIEMAGYERRVKDGAEESAKNN